VKPRSAHSGAQLVGQVVEDLEVVARLEPTPAGNDDFCSGQLWALTLAQLLAEPLAQLQTGELDSWPYTKISKYELIFKELYCNFIIHLIKRDLNAKKYFKFYF
jgi:hypothetical protein